MGIQQASDLTVWDFPSVETQAPAPTVQPWSGWLVILICQECGAETALPTLHASPGAAESARGWLPLAEQCEILTLAEALSRGLIGNGLLAHFGLTPLETS